MELAPASGLGLKVGDRLEFAILDRSGQVLLQRGKVIPTDAILQRLVERGHYEIRRAVEAVLPGVVDVDAALARESSTAGRLALLVAEIDRIFRELVRAEPTQVTADLDSVLSWQNELFAPLRWPSCWPSHKGFRARSRSASQLRP